ncbi:MAG: hypothetical protein HY867_17295 [Chloroflexi bacterium]|nr:hypothetical protein [Chloroflexota bacterium]
MKRSFTNNAKYLLIGFLVGALIFVVVFVTANLLADKHALSLPTSATETGTATLAPAFTFTITPVFAATNTATPTLAITSTPLPPEGEAFSIGKSIEGKPLEMYRFGSGPIVRVIIGAIHGGYESNTATLVYLLRDDLKNHTIVVPEEITLYLLPILNPDGYFDFLNQPEGRGNARSVDINRNWSVLWQPDWDRTGCFSYLRLTAGEHPFSEPEAIALRDFLLANKVDALISYHSAMSAIFAGGQPDPDPASDSLARALSAASLYLYPPTNDPGCQYTGQLIDWAAAQGIAAVDVELTDHQSNDILINRKALEAFLAWRR